MLSLEKLEVKLAELRGLCVHSWKIIREGFCGCNNFGVYVNDAHIWQCENCDKETYQGIMSSPIDDPIAQDLGRLVDLAKEHNINYRMYSDEEWCRITIINDEGAFGLSPVDYKDYSLPQVAHCMALGNMIVSVLEEEK